MRWLRANKHDLAPLTGTDTRALLAIAGCWRLFFSSDNRDSVLRAVRELLRSMQPKCWHFAKALIPWAGDWSHEDPTWHRLAELDPSVVPEFFSDHRAGVRGEMEPLGRDLERAAGVAGRVKRLFRDGEQCQGSHDDGAPCRKSAVAGRLFCEDHGGAL